MYSLYSLLAINLPGGESITAPKSVPTGGIETLNKILGSGMTIFMIVGIILCLFFLVWSGMQWTSSGGDKNKIAAARARITYAIIGLVVILLAYFIVNAVGSIFGVKLVGK